HFDPEKEGPSAGTNLLKRVCCGVMNLLYVVTVDLLPIVRVKNTECERIGFASRHADAVGVIFDDEQERQCLFLSERNCFEEIALARRGIANRCDHDIFFAIELNAPGDAACWKKL